MRLVGRQNYFLAFAIKAENSRGACGNDAPKISAPRKPTIASTVSPFPRCRAD